MLIVMLWHDAFIGPDDFIDLNGPWKRSRLASLPSLIFAKTQFKNH